MTQQEQPQASPNGMPAFKEVVLSAVLYHLKVDGPEKTREYFHSQTSFYAHYDQWPEIQREADDMILAYESSSQIAIVSTGKPLENRILKKNHHGRPIDFEKLRQIITLHFINELRHFYDWLALWRILYDLKLLEDTHMSAFAEQMNNWFPHATKRCQTDSMDDYGAPYLGKYPYASWTDKAFIASKTPKQSMTGYLRLCDLCETLRTELQPIPVIK